MADHTCDAERFPCVTTTILQVHTDEVWSLEWSHSGKFLASAKIRVSLSVLSYAALWMLQPNLNPDISLHLRLQDHQFAVGCLAWSLDDTILLSSCEQFIKMWNTGFDVLIRTIEAHIEPVSTLAWVPDGSGFISASLERKINSLASSVPLAGQLTSVKISSDSQYALVNHAPEGCFNPDPSTRPDTQSVRGNQEIHLWDLFTRRLACKYTGQRQGRHIIHSYFGGVDGKFVVSSSEDGKVYVWHRDRAILLDVLTGHGSGSVNSVAWNPRNTQKFASCSDDCSIRLWEPSTSKREREHP